MSVSLTVCSRNYTHTIKGYTDHVVKVTVDGYFDHNYCEVRIT